MSDETNKNMSKEALWGGGRSPFGVTYGKMMMWFFLVSDALTFGGLLVAYGFSRASSTEPWPIAEQVFRALPGLDGEYPLIYVALMTFILIISSVTMVLAVEAGHRNDRSSVLKWMGLTIIGGAFFLGSQAWEWSHFIHGGGGGFLLEHPVTVEGDDGITYQMQAGDVVYMDHHFGHLMEQHLNGNAQVVLEAGHGHVSLTDHSDHAHVVELHELTINKYVAGETHVEGFKMYELWESRSDSYTFGANLEESEYAQQQAFSDFFFFITGFHGFHVFSGVVINIIIFFMVLKGVMDKRGHYEMVEKVGLYWHFVDLVWVFVFTFFYLI